MASYLVPADKSHFVKSLKTSLGNTYTYLSLPPSSPSSPTILFLHGFPTAANIWRHQVTHFSSLGIGLLVPDLLGYGGSSRPLDVGAYTGKKMAQEISEILDDEGFGEGGKKVYGVAHDWGSFLLARLANWFPGRLCGAAFLGIAYRPSGGANLRWLDEFNELTKRTLGREALGYWKFFEREDAAAIVETHFDTFFNLIFPADPKIWETNLAPLGAIETCLKSDQVIERADFVTDEDKAIYIKIMGRNLSPALNWYRRAIACLDIPDETAPVDGSSERKPILDPKLHIPVLFVDSSRDPLSFGEWAIREMKTLIEDLTLEKVDASHWPQLEKPQDINRILEDWISSVA